MKKILGIIGAFVAGVMFVWTTITSSWMYICALAISNGDNKKLSSWIDSIGK